MLAYEVFSRRASAALAHFRQSELGRFVMLWSLASAVGGLALEACASFNIVLAGAGLGFLLGVPQWVVLRTWRRHASAWVWLTAGAIVAAWVLGAITTILLLILLPFGVAPAGERDPQWVTLLGEASVVLRFVVAAAIAGSLVGFLQAGLLCPAGESSRGWVVASALGVVAFWAVLIGVHLPFGGWDGASAFVHLSSGVAAGLAYGLITAPSLHGLLVRLDPQLAAVADRVRWQGRCADALGQTLPEIRRALRGLVA